MTPERFHQVDEIFQEALDLPPGEREAFLEKACGPDTALREEVRQLLAHISSSADSNDHHIGGTILAAIKDMATPDPRKAEGRRIGPYRVVSLIGRGGMGSVYLAVRDDDFQQQVAIKLVRGGMDSEEVLRRFRYERQLLAFLTHPNIARLLDGGTTDEGEPYLVMEYIEGQPITQYCWERNLSIDERIDLFLAVCAGVQHAHASLIVHRDLKPGNILVTTTGIPKLLDFGVAKLLLPSIESTTLPGTITGLRMFTPDYASPEQVSARPITTATDVYSLGVILFEMLTGRCPHVFQERNALEIERLICHTEVEKPSVAARNAGAPPRVCKQLAHDLDNILLKAMRKEPERRYGSVEELAEDLRRHQEGLPVRAHKDSLQYRMSKFAGRHRVGLLATTLVVLSMATGTAVALQQARRAERRFQEVRKLANTALFDIHDQIQQLPGSTAVREMVVATALRYLDGLASDSRDDPSLQLELAAAYQRIGDVQGNPLGPNLGQFRPALASYRRALSLLEGVAKHRRDYEVMQRMTWLHLLSGDLETRTESLDAAMKSYSAALPIAQAVQATDPRGDELLAQSYLRICYAQLLSGNENIALDNARLAAAAADRSAEAFAGAGGRLLLVLTRMRLGEILWIRGDLDGAFAAYRSAAGWQEQSLAEQPDNPAEMEQMQTAYRRVGDLLGNPSFFYLGDTEQAELYHRKALNLAERLAARDPNNARAKATLYDETRRLAAVMRESKPAQSVALYERSLAGYEALWKLDPTDLGYKRDLANTRLGHAVALTQLHRFKAALAELNETVSAQREILKRDPERQVVEQDLLDALLALGKVQMATGDYDAATRSLSECIAIARKISSAGKAGLYEERYLALANSVMGDLGAELATRAHGAEAARYRSEAGSHYADALAIWSRWRSENLAKAYASREEQAVLRSKTALEQTLTVNH